MTAFKKAIGAMLLLAASALAASGDSHFMIVPSVNATDAGPKWGAWILLRSDRPEVKSYRVTVVWQAAGQVKSIVREVEQGSAPWWPGYDAQVAIPASSDPALKILAVKVESITVKEVSQPEVGKEQ